MSDPSPVFAREVVRHEPVRRDLRVVRSEELTSTMVRITVGGESLARFSSVGPEDHVKLFFPAPVGERIARDYTPLAFSPDRLELDIDVVLHGDSGPATRWAGAARPGDPIVVGGPRGSRRAPAGARKYVLLADESALPAMSRWIRAAGVNAEVLAFV
ncbi:MAG TPA: siderophore-interacting protein, partial [Naasia sp.]